VKIFKWANGQDEKLFPPAPARVLTLPKRPYRENKEPAVYG
jgi:hypothetical protein